MIQPWRQIQAQNIRRFSSLTEHLGLETDQLAGIEIDPKFPINIPRRLVEKMEKGNPHDPLFLQFIPQRLESVEGGTKDPVGDLAARRTPRLLHKYKGRALLTVTSACAMHCRYCFRKEFPYFNGGEFSQELEVIKNDSSIQEVILSGGDPLSLSDKNLGQLLRAIDSVDHVKLVRFHTRFPIGIPERITEDFLTLLNLHAQVWFVVHINHPRELDTDVSASLKKIQRLGIPVLNQSVLMRGVNDTFAVHKELLEKLIRVGIQPYYLHQLDPVTGSGHFNVPTHEGLQLIDELRAALPGYAIPEYVQEVAGDASKRPVRKNLLLSNPP